MLPGMDEAMKQRANERAARMRAGFVEPTRSVPPAATTPVERLAGVWALTCDVWQLTGRPWPAYTRATMPGLMRSTTDE